MQQINTVHILEMGNPPFFLAVHCQPLGPGGPMYKFLHFCSSALPVCGKTHSVKSDPELRVFRLEWSISIQNMHLQ